MKQKENDVLSRSSGFSCFAGSFVDPKSIKSRIRLFSHSTHPSDITDNYVKSISTDGSVCGKYLDEENDGFYTYSEAVEALHNFQELKRHFTFERDVNVLVNHVLLKEIDYSEFNKKPKNFERLMKQQPIYSAVRFKLNDFKPLKFNLNINNSINNKKSVAIQSTNADISTNIGGIIKGNDELFTRNRRIIRKKDENNNIIINKKLTNNSALKKGLENKFLSSQTLSEFPSSTNPSDNVEILSSSYSISSSYSDDLGKNADDDYDSYINNDSDSSSTLAKEEYTQKKNESSNSSKINNQRKNEIVINDNSKPKNFNFDISSSISNNISNEAYLCKRKNIENKNRNRNLNNIIDGKGKHNSTILNKKEDSAFEDQFLSSDTPSEITSSPNSDLMPNSISGEYSPSFGEQNENKNNRNKKKDKQKSKSKKSSSSIDIETNPTLEHINKNRRIKKANKNTSVDNKLKNNNKDNNNNKANKDKNGDNNKDNNKDNSNDDSTNGNNTDNHKSKVSKKNKINRNNEIISDDVVIIKNQNDSQNDLSNKFLSSSTPADVSSTDFHADSSTSLNSDFEILENNSTKTPRKLRTKELISNLRVQNKILKAESPLSNPDSLPKNNLNHRNNEQRTRVVKRKIPISERLGVKRNFINENHLSHFKKGKQTNSAFVDSEANDFYLTYENDNNVNNDNIDNIDKNNINKDDHPIVDKRIPPQNKQSDCISGNCSTPNENDCINNSGRVDKQDSIQSNENRKNEKRLKTEVTYSFSVDGSSSELESKPAYYVFSSSENSQTDQSDPSDQKKKGRNYNYYGRKGFNSYRNQNNLSLHNSEHIDIGNNTPNPNYSTSSGRSSRSNSLSGSQNNYHDKKTKNNNSQSKTSKNSSPNDVSQEKLLNSSQTSFGTNKNRRSRKNSTNKKGEDLNEDKLFTIKEDPDKKKINDDNNNYNNNDNSDDNTNDNKNVEVISFKVPRKKKLKGHHHQIKGKESLVFDSLVDLDPKKKLIDDTEKIPPFNSISHFDRKNKSKNSASRMKTNSSSNDESTSYLRSPNNQPGTDDIEGFYNNESRKRSRRVSGQSNRSSHSSLKNPSESCYDSDFSTEEDEEYSYFYDDEEDFYEDDFDEETNGENEGNKSHLRRNTVQTPRRGSVDIRDPMEIRKVKSFERIGMTQKEDQLIKPEIPDKPDQQQLDNSNFYNNDFYNNFHHNNAFFNKNPIIHELHSSSHDEYTQNNYSENNFAEEEKDEEEEEEEGEEEEVVNLVDDYDDNNNNKYNSIEEFEEEEEEAFLSENVKYVNNNKFNENENSANNNSVDYYVKFDEHEDQYDYEYSIISENEDDMRKNAKVKHFRSSDNLWKERNSINESSPSLRDKRKLSCDYEYKFDSEKETSDDNNVNENHANNEQTADQFDVSKIRKSGRRRDKTTRQRPYSIGNLNCFDVGNLDSNGKNQKQLLQQQSLKYKKRKSGGVPNAVDCFTQKSYLFENKPLPIYQLREERANSMAFRQKQPRSNVYDNNKYTNSEEEEFNINNEDEFLNISNNQFSYDDFVWRLNIDDPESAQKVKLFIPAYSFKDLENENVQTIYFNKNFVVKSNSILLTSPPSNISDFNSRNTASSPLAATNDTASYFSNNSLSNNINKQSVPLNNLCITIENDASQILLSNTDENLIESYKPDKHMSNYVNNSIDSRCKIDDEQLYTFFLLPQLFPITKNLPLIKEIEKKILAIPMEQRDDFLYKKAKSFISHCLLPLSHHRIAKECIFSSSLRRISRKSDNSNSKSHHHHHHHRKSIDQSESNKIGNITENSVLIPNEINNSSSISVSEVHDNKEKTGYLRVNKTLVVGNAKYHLKELKFEVQNENILVIRNKYGYNDDDKESNKDNKDNNVKAKFITNIANIWVLKINELLNFKSRSLLDLYLFNLSSHSPSISFEGMITSAITSPFVNFTIHLLNHEKFSFDLAESIFRIFSRYQRIDFLMRTLLFAEVTKAKRKNDFLTIFLTKSKYSLALFKLFTSVSFNWLYRMALNIKVNEISDAEHLIDFIIFSFSKAPSKALFIIRNVIIITAFDSSSYEVSTATISGRASKCNDYYHPLLPFFNFLLSCLKPFFVQYHPDYVTKFNDYHLQIQSLLISLDKMKSRSVLSLAPFMSTILHINMVFGEVSLKPESPLALYRFMIENIADMLKLFEKEQKCRRSNHPLMYSFYQNLKFLMRDKI